MSVLSLCNFVNEQRALESYCVLPQTASLPDENETQDGRDDRLGEGEEEEGGLHSSAHLLLERDTHKMHALGAATGLKRRDRGRICISTTMFSCCAVIRCSSAKTQSLPPRNCSPHCLWMVLGEKRGVLICSADAFSSFLPPSFPYLAPFVQHSEREPNLKFIVDFSFSELQLPWGQNCLQVFFLQS